MIERSIEVTMQTITVKLSSDTYQQMAQRAALKKHSIEDEAATVIESALHAQDDWLGIPQDIAEEVAQLKFLDDTHLWRVAQANVSDENAEQMQTLLWKQQTEGLTEAEEQEVVRLRLLANRIMLLKAEAAVLLQERGHDLSTLNPQ
jgi:hypothetical protein